MVRRSWAVALVEWILRLLSFLWRAVSRLGLFVATVARIIGWMVKPRAPDNLFAADDGGTPSRDIGPPPPDGAAVPTLLWAGPAKYASDASSASLWRGRRVSSASEAAAGAETANRRHAHTDLLALQLGRLSPDSVDELDRLVHKLARRWLDVAQSFQQVPRRNALDMRRTLRANIRRYGGRVLEFRWSTKQRPVAQFARPAHLLLVGDVSHSMVRYVTVVLHYFHRLNFRFAVDSYIFSDRATHASPFLNGLGTFEQKVQRLMSGATSWNAGTRFGTALEEIARAATLDEHTYVIIATDGKVSLQGDETAKIEQYLAALRRRVKQVIFLTPSVEFSDGASGRTRPPQVGSLKYDFYDIPVFEAGPPLWYGVLGKYADRIYLVRTVRDLVCMTEDLMQAARSPQM